MKIKIEKIDDLDWDTSFTSMADDRLASKIKALIRVTNQTTDVLNTSECEGEKPNFTYPYSKDLGGKADFSTKQNVGWEQSFWDLVDRLKLKAEYPNDCRQLFSLIHQTIATAERNKVEEVRKRLYEIYNYPCDCLKRNIECKHGWSIEFYAFRDILQALNKEVE